MRAGYHHGVCYRYSQHEHVSGETLSREMQVYRIQLVTTSLKAGIPLNKINVFRDLQ